MRKTIGFLAAVGALVLGGEALATTTTFTCYCLGERSVGRGGCGPRGPKRMTARVTTASIRLQTTERDWAFLGQARFTYDRTYRPRSNSTYLRFLGPAGSSMHLLAEKALTTGGQALRGGGKGGYLRFERRGDAFESTSYLCRR